METKSPKEQQVEAKLRKQVEDLASQCAADGDLPVRLLDILLEHPEITALQNYANTVSISRIGLNDHGPVHMKTVTRNALKILGILHEAGVQTCVEKEQTGTFTDSIMAVMFAAMLHDSGMTIARKNHELYSGIICHTLIGDILQQLFPEEKDMMRRVVIRSLAMEGILGHMGSHPIHSIEAGVILHCRWVRHDEGTRTHRIGNTYRTCRGRHAQILGPQHREGQDTPRREKSTED